MAEFDIFPDAEDIAQQILATGIASFSPFSPHIGTKIPTTPVWDQGVVTVQRVGGVPVERHRLDHPRIQVDVWASTKFNAQKMAQQARVLLMLSEGKTISANTSAFITLVEDALGLSWIFDSQNMTPRYTFSVLMTLHV